MIVDAFNGTGADQIIERRQADLAIGQIQQHRDGTAQVACDPVDFIPKALAALMGQAGAKAQSQSGPLPLRPCPKSPLSWGGHTGQAWQGAKEGCQYRTKDTGRVSRGNDLGATIEAHFQHTPGHPLLMLRINSPCRHKGLRPLWWGCQSHRLH